MTYPPQPGGYDPYGQQQQPGYGPQPSGPPYQEPMTSVPSSPAAGYPQQGYGHPGYPQPAYGAPTPPPAPPERPQKVTIGAMSMVGLAVLWMFSALMGVIFNNQLISNVEETCQEMNSNSEYSYTSSCSSSMEGTSGFQLFFSFFNFLWLIGFIIAALFVLRGFNWARVTGFILNGVSIAWNLLVMTCMGIMFATISSIQDSMSSYDSYDTSGSTPSVDDIIPGWYLPSILIISFLSIAISAVSIFLLANRETSDWFRSNTHARAAGVI